MNKKEDYKLDLILGFLIVLILAFVFVYPVFFNNLYFYNKGNNPAVVALAELENKGLKNKTNPFNDLILDARTASVFDVSTHEFLFQKNGNEVRPLASLTKIVTAVVALQNLSPETSVVIHTNDLLPEGDSGFFVGEKWQLGDLTEFTLMESSNDGASAIASNVGLILSQLESADQGERFFINLMNKTIKEWGINQSYFLNPSGLDLALDKSGAYGTADDMAIIMAKFLENYPKILKSTGYLTNTYFSESGFEHKAKNTNQFVNNLPSVLGSKTGFTDLAGGNLVLVFDAGFNRPIIVVVLGSTLEGRFSDAEKLAWATIQFLALNK